jgi:hypothetical protein
MLIEDQCSSLFASSLSHDVTAVAGIAADTIDNTFTPKGSLLRGFQPNLFNSISTSGIISGSTSSTSGSGLMMGPAQNQALPLVRWEGIGMMFTTAIFR